jgi:hypothetical protein
VAQLLTEAPNTQCILIALEREGYSREECEKLITDIGSAEDPFAVVEDWAGARASYLTERLLAGESERAASGEAFLMWRLVMLARGVATGRYQPVLALR